MDARRRLLCPLCSLSPGTGVPGEGLFVYMLSVSWRGSRGRLVCLHVVCLLERFQGKACQWSVATYAWTKLYTKIMS